MACKLIAGQFNPGLFQTQNSSPQFSTLARPRLFKNKLRVEKSEVEAWGKVIYPKYIMKTCPFLVPARVDRQGSTENFCKFFHTILMGETITKLQFP